MRMKSSVQCACREFLKAMNSEPVPGAEGMVPSPDYHVQCSVFHVTIFNNLDDIHAKSKRCQNTPQGNI